MRRFHLALGAALVGIGLIGMVCVAIYFGITNVRNPHRTPLAAVQSPSGLRIDPSLLRLLLTDFSKSSYASNGERLFLTGQDNNGAFITMTSGYPLSGSQGSMMGNGLMMGVPAQFSCANCHGPDARGGYVFPDGDTQSADIRWSTLSAPTDETGSDTATSTTKKGRDLVTPYTEETFKKAIMDGIDPDGNRLSYYMPLWSISDADANDLIAYLKTLSTDVISPARP